MEEEPTYKRIRKNTKQTASNEAVFFYPQPLKGGIKFCKMSDSAMKDGFSQGLYWNSKYMVTKLSVIIKQH